MQPSYKSLFGRMKGLLSAIAAAMALTAIIAACGGGEPEELTFNLDIEQRALSEEDATIEAKQDDKLTIVLTSDEPVNYHLHGYDLEGNVGPDAPATLEFDAYATGSFPITIHVPAQAKAEDAMDTGGESEDHSATIEAPQDMSVSVEVLPDAVSGVNLAIDTTGFDFAPHNVNGHHVEGEGHAHVYVDGEKITRLYGPYFHLDNVDPGERTISVVLNANTHQEYAIGDEVVAASTMVVIESSSGSGHGHGDAGSGGGEQEEEIELGRLVVQPR